MSWARALVIALVVSGASAALVAVSSRAPAPVRHADFDRSDTDPSLGATFTDEQIERHGIFRRSAYLGFALGLALEILVLVLLARGPLGRAVDVIQGLRGGLVVHAALTAAVLAALTTIAALPLSFVRGYVIGRAWGLSTQTPLGWTLDLVKGFGVGLVIAAVSTIAFFALVRWQPRAWWLWGWAAFTLLSVLMVWLYPVAIAPLFNKFTPLEDAALTERITQVAQDAGVEVDEVLVADASRRTTGENAYVAGFGATRQVVLYDTLLESGSEDETLFVVAHELGHDKESHVTKNLLLTSFGLFVGFGALKLLQGWGGLWSWAGASGISDLRALPVLLLFGVIAGFLTLPAQNAVSRAFERRADEIAFELTGEPGVAVRSFRRLAFANIADLRPPPPAVWLLFSHPSVPDRIEAALQAGSAAP